MAAAAALGMLYLAAAARLGHLTLFTDARVEVFADRQRYGSVNLAMPRGAIYDRNLNELAVSIRLKSIYIDPRAAGDAPKAAARLARVLEPEDSEAQARERRRLARSLRRDSGKRFMWVSRKVSPETFERVKAANIPGVSFVNEYKRYYPKRDMASKVVGFCGIDNQGLYGLEYEYDEVIRPRSATSRVRRDALGRAVSSPDALTIPEAVAPYDLALTIDERVQYVAEQALERRVRATGAKGGVAIVMDPNTGEVLAVAGQPRFNPNAFARYEASAWKPEAVAHAVEPGSTFKVFVAAAALDERAARASEVFDCEDGEYTVGGKVFHEANSKRFRLLSVPEIISNSSNIGAIKLAERLGPARLRERLAGFGFGARTGIDLPGESAGLLRPVSNWSHTSLPSISFGQEVAVTPIQLAVGVSAIANGGWVVRPRLVREYLRGGKAVTRMEPKVERRAVSAETARAVTAMMEQVVAGGTGTAAATPGYRVAGKTGTAQKIDPSTGAYSPEKSLSSFVGFFPVEDPRLVIVVMIDEPRGLAWGGHVAGPVFSEIAARAARILRIPAAGAEVYEIDWERMRDRSGERAGGAAAEPSWEEDPFGALERLWQTAGNAVGFI